MKLGSACQITIGTSNVLESYEFYKILGFRKLAEDSKPFPWVKITDDSLVILLFENGDLYLSLSYFDSNMRNTVKELSAGGVKFVQQKTNEHIFVSQTDTVVVLVNAEHEGRLRPDNRTLLDLPESDFYTLARYPNPRLGIFGELSHTVSNLETSIQYWKKLGFELHQRAETPYPWALLYDGLMNIGLHECTDFDGPILSYFACDVPAKVAELNEKGIYSITPYTGIISGENSVVIRTPENQQVFLFEI